MAAGPAYLQLQGSLAALPSVESFHLQETGSETSQLRITDLFTGIILAPGSEARRLTVTVDEEQRALGEAVARHQRNFSGYARTQLHNEQQAAQIIAQLNDVVGRAPPAQAVQQLLDLAEQYRRNRQWDYYDAVLMQIIENYPAEPSSALAAVQLIQLWTSREMTQLRLSNRSTNMVARSIDTARWQEDLEQKVASALESEFTPVEQVRPAVNEEVQQKTLTPGTRMERAAWEQTWQQRALVVYRLLQQRAPELARSPDVQLAMASLYRDRGASRGEQSILQQYLREGTRRDEPRPVLQQLAEAEFWLLSRTGVPPRRYLACEQVSRPPYLDGLLSDECWQEAEEIRLKVSGRSAADPALAGLETPIVMIGHDAEYFYLAGSFPRHPELPAPPVHQGGRRHDADLTGQDRLQIAFDLDRDYQSALILEVDQRGLTSDTCWLDPSWNPRWYVASQADETHWRVELAIPLAELSTLRQVRPNEAWGISLARILPGIGVQSWGDQLGTQPERSSFGLMHFR